MKVGILIHKCSGGGAERVASEISLLLVEQGVEVYFLTFFKEDKEYPHAGVRLSFEQEKTGSLLVLFMRLRWVRRLKREQKLDAVISFLPEANLINLLTGGDTILSFRNNPESLSTAYKMLFGLTLHGAKRIVAISKGVEDCLIRMYPAVRGKTTTIYNPIAPFSAYERPIRSVKRIIHVGRLSNQKAQQHLLEAFRILAPTRPELMLRMIGNGVRKEEFERWIQENDLADRVEMIPFTWEIEREYEEADLLVLCSVYEGFGNVITEALTKGLPVISTDCPFGPREILAPTTLVNEVAKQVEIHEFGILTPWDDGEETAKCLAKAIARVIDDDELRIRLQEWGPKRAKDFSREKVGQAWRRILNM